MMEELLNKMPLMLEEVIVDAVVQRAGRMVIESEPEGSGIVIEVEQMIQKAPFLYKSSPHSMVQREQNIDLVIDTCP